MIYNIDRAVKRSSVINKTYVGEVVKNDDSLGRIKVMIPSRFNGISTSNLPWIRMNPSNGMMVTPEIGSHVIVRFENTIYEGYYSSIPISSDKLSDYDISDLGDSYILDLRGTVIHGKYDGSQISIKTEKLSIVEENGVLTIENDSGAVIEADVTGNININGKELTGTVNITGGNIEIDPDLFLKAQTQAVIPEGAGPFCALPTCVITGTPHTGKQSI